VTNLTNSGKWEGCHIVVSSLGTLKNTLDSRLSIDLTALKVIVIDEADFVFRDDQLKRQLEGLKLRVFDELVQQI
jgi:superfamily II DNA/RNA helicase